MRRLSIDALLGVLASRQMTNVLVEGGSKLLGSLMDAGSIDEVHVFIAAKILGGQSAVTAVAGLGRDDVPEFGQLDPIEMERTGDDLYVHGPLRRDDSG